MFFFQECHKCHFNKPDDNLKNSQPNEECASWNDGDQQDQLFFLKKIYLFLKANRNQKRLSGGGRGIVFREGDWNCPSCQAHNFARRIVRFFF